MEWRTLVKGLRKGSPDSLTIYCINTMEDADLEKFAIKMWCIWKERCDITHKKRIQQTGGAPRTLVAWTDAYLDQFHNETSKLSQRLSIPSKISRPPPNHMNYAYWSLNVDAAYNEPTLTFAIGFYIKDQDGKPRAAGCHRIPPPGSVMAAEITALVEGLSFYLDRFQEPIKIFSDCIDAIQALTSDSIYKGYEETLINRARKLTLHTSMKGVWYCPRSDNTAAHNLAQLATKSPLPHAWVGEDIPRRFCL